VSLICGSTPDKHGTCPDRSVSYGCFCPHTSALCGIHRAVEIKSGTVTSDGAAWRTYG
jgi:hypothetical protein